MHLSSQNVKKQKAKRFGSRKASVFLYLGDRIWQALIVYDKLYMFFDYLSGKGNRRQTMRKKTYLIISLVLVMCIVLSFAGCAARNTDAAETDAADSGIDYLALVNKQNRLPEGWDEALETVHLTNSIGDDVEVEKKAFDAYEQLRKDLEQNDGIFLELDSARRTAAQQQDIWDRYMVKYGKDYTLKTVAPVWYSEHHTGIALDLYFRMDGKDVYYNEDMVQHPDVWEKVHAKLADYGFILRYPEGKEHITGYGYEPWHIRYVDSVDVARDIMRRGITLEEYLGAVNEYEIDIDYGNSHFYTDQDLYDAVLQIKCDFAFWPECELHSIRYAGDAYNNEENLNRLNSMKHDKKFTQLAKFTGDFHTTDNASGVLSPNKDYNDFVWWLARGDDDGWYIVDKDFS